MFQSERPAGLLGQHLGIGLQARVLLRSAPAAFTARLALLPLEHDVRTTLRGGAPVDVAIGFARSLADVERHLRELRPRLADAGALWLAWPAQSNREPTNCTADAVRARAFATGLVDAKVGAVERGWTGIRFIPRAPDRRREPDSRAEYDAVR